MIFDRLENASRYNTLGPRFKAGFDYLQKTNFALLASGRHEILGSDLFALNQTYPTKPTENGKWEAHRAYADVQYIISGRERMGIAPLSKMTVREPYNQEKDAALFSGQGQFVLLETGDFVIFFPTDVHMPGIAIDKPENVRKIVLKVRL